jgi:hypothetical protein
VAAVWMGRAGRRGEKGKKENGTTHGRE